MNWKKATPIILSIAGSIGTVGTAVLASIGTAKALRNIDEIKEKDKLTKKELIKIVVKSYAPAVSVGLATLAANTSGTIISQKQQASLTATCYALSKGYNKYKDKVNQVAGMGKHLDVLNEIIKDDPPKNEMDNDGKKLYWEENIGYFRADPEDFAFATSDLNQRFHVDDGPNHSGYYSTLKDLVDGCNAELLDKKDTSYLENLGWNGDYLFDKFGYCWVHVWLDPVVLEDGMECNKVLFVESYISNPTEYPEESDYIYSDKYRQQLEREYYERDYELVKEMSEAIKKNTIKETKNENNMDKEPW